MSHFKEHLESFRPKVEAFYEFLASEFDDLDAKTSDKEILAFEKLLPSFISSVESMRKALEKEWTQLKKEAKTPEDHASIPPLKEIAVIQSAFIFRYYNGKVTRLNKQIDLFNEKIATFMQYFFIPLFDDKSDWLTIKKELDNKFPLFLKTIAEEYEKIFHLRKTLLNDVNLINKKYGYDLDIAGQITMPDDLKNVERMLLKQRAFFIEKHKKREYKKRIREYQEQIIQFEKEIVDMEKIAHHDITISQMCAIENSPYLEGMLRKYCELQEKIGFDDIAIQAEVEALKLEYPYLNLEVPVMPHLNVDPVEIKKGYENTLKKAWKIAIGNDLDKQYDTVIRDKIISKKSDTTENTDDKVVYVEHFKQKVETLKRKDTIIQILNGRLEKSPAYWEKLKKAKRNRQFQEESAWFNQELQNQRDNLVKCFPNTFVAIKSSTSFLSKSTSMLRKESFLPDQKQKCKRKPVPEYKCTPIKAPPLSPIFNTCHFMLSCLCFGMGGLLYLGYYAYQYYQYRKKELLPYRFFCSVEALEKKKALEKKDAAIPHKDLICPA